MKIYVDEMPKSCDECELVRYFKQKGKTMSWCPVDCLMRDVGVKNTCPLHSTAELQNEKAVECLEKVKAIALSGECDDNLDWVNETQKVFNEFILVNKINQLIDELKGGKNGK